MLGQNPVLKLARRSPRQKINNHDGRTANHAQPDAADGNADVRDGDRKLLLPKSTYPSVCLDFRVRSGLREFGLLALNRGMRKNVLVCVATLGVA